MNIRKVIMKIMGNEKKNKTFLVREIPPEKWKRFKIKTIEGNQETCNDVMLSLIDKYIRT